uniref:Ig-like domain-containing protein n=1 Tax=Chelonoidis abingdonii TaxID=106734 RepID=A0A8C0H4Y0_CHEAB
CSSLFLLGEPVPEVQWFKGNHLIFSNVYYTVVHNPDGSGSLTVHQCQRDDGGLYTCKAINPLGEATCSAELLVLDTAAEFQYKEQKVVQKHLTKSYKETVSELTTESRLYAVKLPVTVAWNKDGNKIPPGKDYKIYFEDKIASLEIPLAKLKDSGHYVCTASNEAGSSSSSATVTIRGQWRVHVRDCKRCWTQLVHHHVHCVRLVSCSLQRTTPFRFKAQMGQKSGYILKCSLYVLFFLCCVRNRPSHCSVLC